MLFFTQYNAEWVTAISANCLASLPVT